MGKAMQQANNTGSSPKAQKLDVPEGLWMKCEKCSAMIYRKQMEENLYCCPECGKHLNIKVGKNGHYIGCSGYPECGFTTNYTRDEKGNIKLVEKSSDDVSDKVCDKCGKPMLIKNGQYGKFMACSGYPDCKNTQSLVLNGYLKDTGVNCPKEKCSGKIVEKKSRRGKIFYSCDNYPDCDFAIWEKPVNTKCPECGADFLVEKKTKKEGKFLLCINQKCGYKEKINTE